MSKRRLSSGRSWRQSSATTSVLRPAAECAQVRSYVVASAGMHHCFRREQNPIVTICAAWAKRTMRTVHEYVASALSLGPARHHGYSNVNMEQSMYSVGGGVQAGIGLQGAADQAVAARRRAQARPMERNCTMLVQAYVMPARCQRPGIHVAKRCDADSCGALDAHPLEGCAGSA